MTSLASPETLNRIAEWRRKSEDRTITPDELKAAIIVLRENRRTATVPTKKASRAKAPARSADSLLSELDNL